MAARVKLPASAQELRETLDAVDGENPSPEEISKLENALKKMPKLSQALGDVMELAASHITDSMMVPQVTKLALVQQRENLMQSLGLEQATALEGLLIEQVGLAWLRLGYVELRYTNVQNDGGSIKKMDYWERRLNAAQRRYLRACTTLARVQKMDLPPIQVNIGQQQVNQLNTS